MDDTTGNLPAIVTTRAEPSRGTSGGSVVAVGRALTLVGALCIVALGLLLGSLSLIASLLEPGDGRLLMATLSISILALTTGLGLPLAWHAFQALQGRASRPFAPRWAWPIGALFVLAVLVGHLVLNMDAPSAVSVALFPLLHVAGSVLPALTVVAAVGRSLAGTSRWRDVVLQINSGAFLSTTLAFTLEFALIIALVVALVGVIALQPGGLEQIQLLVDRLQDPAWQKNPAELVQSPLVMVAVLLVVAVAIPIMEEAVKTVGVGLMAYRRPTLQQAFLWGLIGGAGFALAEGLFNSLGGLDEWATIVLLRVGAALLHCFAGALMGLAWYAVLAERRWRRGLSLYAGAVCTHGLWNTLAAAMAYMSLRTVGESGATLEPTAAQMGMAAIPVLLAGMALAITVGLVLATRCARGHDAHQPLP